jgi:predicted TIM-barrel fold metal-dependent hydrolase
MIIDADAHVVESERTWDYMDPSDSQFRPVVVTIPDEQGKPRHYWLIDGKIRNVARMPVDGKDRHDPSVISEETAAAARTSGRAMAVPLAFRHLEDVAGRVSHMDQLGTDIQVLFSTIFTHRVADRAEVEVALCRSYNRWMADVWRQGKGRLRWVAILPYSAMDEAVKEAKAVVPNGACAVAMRAVEGERLPSDPAFYPLYGELSRLDLPIALHIGNSNTRIREVLSNDGFGGTFSYLRLMSVAAFHSWVGKGVPELFPKLRIGFFEASAQWVPFALHDLKRRFETRGKRMKADLMRECRMYVACQTDDDLPYILTYAGEDNLLIGTDYGHTDQSSDLEALRVFKSAESPVSLRVREKIMDDNARAFYRL